MTAQDILKIDVFRNLIETGSQIRSSLKGKSIKDLRPMLKGLWNDKEKRKLLYIPIAIVTLALTYWVYEEFTTESTDDAFVSAHVHTVGARIPGTVLSVQVGDNQVVKKGDVLIKLDPKDFEVQEKVAEANALKADSNLKRWGDANLHPIEQLQKNIDIASSEIAQANLDQAKLNLQYTDIVAPEDGKIGNRTVETGQQVQPGQALMALVERTPWVIANFKENQVAHMKPGQRAEIYVDALSGREFDGHVDSIAPGSGATFSLLPPDNATGNFTKIVQRIPVKIVFEPGALKGYEDRLAAGMSVAVTVHR